MVDTFVQWKRRRAAANLDGEEPLDLTSKDYQNGRDKGLKEITGTTPPVASNTLSVNVLTAPGKAMGSRINQECAVVFLARMEELSFVGMTRKVA